MDTMQSINLLELDPFLISGGLDTILYGQCKVIMGENFGFHQTPEVSRTSTTSNKESKTRTRHAYYARGLYYPNRCMVG